MRTPIVVLFSVLLAVLVGGLPFGYRSLTSTEYRNLRVVEEGKLYRSGQMSLNGFKRFVKEYGIGTVISLRDSRDEDRPSPDQEEAEYCERHGIEHHRLSPLPWSAADGSVPNAANVEKFLKILDDPKTAKPVLVHCFAGIHRTGGLCAVYRMEHQGWSPKEASREMLGMGTVRTKFDADLVDYVESYVPRRRMNR